MEKHKSISQSVSQSVNQSVSKPSTYPPIHPCTPILSSTKGSPWAEQQNWECPPGLVKSQAASPRK